MPKPHSGPTETDPALRVKALETLLIEKGLVDAATLDAFIDV
jgi:nitrile hydratase